MQTNNTKKCNSHFLFFNCFVYLVNYIQCSSNFWNNIGTMCITFFSKFNFTRQMLTASWSEPECVFWKRYWNNLRSCMMRRLSTLYNLLIQLHVISRIYILYHYLIYCTSDTDGYLIPLVVSTPAFCKSFSIPFQPVCWRYSSIS